MFFVVDRRLYLFCRTTEQQQQLDDENIYLKI